MWTVFNAIGTNVRCGVGVGKVRLDGVGGRVITKMKCAMTMTEN